MEDLAKQLRKRSTDAELKLWYFLRNRQMQGHKFRRQHPLPPYIADFVCLERKLIVELDGGQHVELAVKDAARTKVLEAQGFRVIRFWDDDVLLRSDVVLQEILRYLKTPHPRPLPASGARE